MFLGQKPVEYQEFEKELRKVRRHRGDREDFLIRVQKAAKIAFESRSAFRKHFAEHAHRFVADERNLYIAMEHLRKEGGKAPGPDGLRYKDLPSKSKRFEFCRSIRDEINDQSYKLGETKTIRVTKPGGGSRKLTLMNLDDRIALRGLKQVVEPMIDPEFLEMSYGFRPNRHRAQMIVDLCTRSLAEKRNFWVKADIKSAFPSVCIKEVVRLLSKRFPTQRMRELFKTFLPKTANVGGLPQGSPFSPLCLNLYLHDRIDRLWEKRCPSVPIYRYADDFVLLAKNRREASRSLKSLGFLAEKAGLELKDTAESPIVDLKKGDHLIVLGMDCQLVEPSKFRIRPSTSSTEKMLNKLRSIECDEDATNRVFLTLKGWIDQQALAFSEWRASEILFKVNAVLKEKGLHQETIVGSINNAVDDWMDSDQWHLGNADVWLEFWRKSNSKLLSRLNPQDLNFV